jgi:hypothetical protein
MNSKQRTDGTRENGSGNGSSPRDRRDADVLDHSTELALSRGITLVEIAAKLQLEGVALLRRMAVQTWLSPSPPSDTGSGRGAM